MTTSYNPPVKDMAFVLQHLVGLYDLPKSAELDPETVEAVLEEAGKLARDVLAPLNYTGDRAGNVLKDGVVTTAPGFKDAYNQYCKGGWSSVPFEPDHGGQGFAVGLGFRGSGNVAIGEYGVQPVSAVELKARLKRLKRMAPPNKKKSISKN